MSDPEAIQLQQTLICEEIENRLQIFEGFQSQLDYLYTPSTFSFTISGFTNPPTTEPVYYIVETLQFSPTDKYTIDKSTT